MSTLLYYIVKRYLFLFALYSFCNVHDIQGSKVVFMMPEVAEGFGFVSWKFMKDNNIIPQVIPPAMYTYIKSSNQGIFEVLQSRWKYSRDLR